MTAVLCSTCAGASTDLSGCAITVAGVVLKRAADCSQSAGGDGSFDDDDFDGDCDDLCGAGSGAAAPSSGSKWIVDATFSSFMSWYDCRVPGVPAGSAWHVCV